MYTLFTPPFDGRSEGGLEQACREFYAVQENSTGLDVHAGNVKFRKQNESLSTAYLFF